MTHPIPTPVSPAPKREGAAMLVTMLVLLMATSMAVFAMHATSYEIRAAGASRAQAQAQYVAEAGLGVALGKTDSLGGAWLQNALVNTRSTARVGTDPVIATNTWFNRVYEPSLPPNKGNLSIVMADEVSQGVYALETRVGQDGVFDRTLYQPLYTVDVNDDFLVSRAIPGARSDGRSMFRYLAATYTARGRVTLSGVDSASATPDNFGLHSTASDARAHVFIGPVP